MQRPLRTSSVAVLRTRRKAEVPAPQAAACVKHALCGQLCNNTSLGWTAVYAHRQRCRARWKLLHVKKGRHGGRGSSRLVDRPCARLVVPAHDLAAVQAQGRVGRRRLAARSAGAPPQQQEQVLRARRGPINTRKTSWGGTGVPSAPGTAPVGHRGEEKRARAAAAPHSRRRCGQPGGTARPTSSTADCLLRSRHTWPATG